MKVLAVGDIVGYAGVKELKHILPGLIETEEIDFTIVNAENSADGFGINQRNFDELIAENIDVITMGNHTWGKKDIFEFIDDPKLIRPANYPSGVCGKGYGIYTCKDKKIAVINLIRKNRYECTFRKPIFDLQKDNKIVKRKTSRYNNRRLSCRSYSRKNCDGVLFRWRSYSYFWNTYTCANSGWKNLK